MNFLVVGLGSMGKRRVRCLKALGYSSICGFDRRRYRAEEAAKAYGISTFDNFEKALDASRPHVLIISVPPDVHHVYMKIAAERRIHFFVEASVVDTDIDDIDTSAKHAGIVAAPSATLRFHPGIKLVGSIVNSGLLGTLSNLTYHCGQYLPDWHPYEKVSEYYVSNPLTGGAREIMAFELTWLLSLLGKPKKVIGNVRKTINIEGAEKIDDTYNCLLDFGKYLAVVTVDVVSRFATRRLLINGSERQLRWEWDRNCVEVYEPSLTKWNVHNYESPTAAAGYNVNIGEQMYIEELKSFINAILGGTPFINSLREDHAVLKVLYAIEQSSRQGAGSEALVN
jgi:predicted dehydrogenase